MPTPTMITPATAGPMSRAELKMMALIATAAGRSWRATRLETSARRTGWLNAETTPRNSDRPKSDQMVISPLAVNANSTAAWTANSA